jgi:hypothetical protein
MEPGIHVGVPMAEYLKEPAVSASLLNTLLERCPMAAWHESWLNPKPDEVASSDGQDAGTIAHALLLEGNADKVVVVQARDWRTDAAKDARAAARAAGKIAVLPQTMPKITAMVEAARTYIESLRENEPAIWMTMQPSGGESEVVIRWDERDGTRCKIRPDRISHDRRITIDYKTTGASAEPDAWFRWQAMKLGYPVGAAFYRRGIKAAAGTDSDYVWFVQEQDPPYLCSLVSLEPSARSLSEKKMLRGLQTWSACAASNRWHAYPARVAYAEFPPWEWAKEEGQDEPSGNPYTPEQLRGRAIADSLPDR